MVRTIPQLRDLYRCLVDYAQPMLQALALIWDVEPVLDTEECVTRITRAMQAPGKASQIIEALSPLAQQALTLLRIKPEGVPSHRLSVNFGQIRKLGPAGLEREQPWSNPQSPLEELFYKGIIYRAYGTLPGYYGEVLWVPVELADQIEQGSPNTPSQETTVVTTPVAELYDTQAICEDVLTILIRIKLGHFRRENKQIASRKLPWERMDLQERLLGSQVEERLALLELVISRAKLLDESEGILQPSTRARYWMRSELPRRLAALLVAWRDDPYQNEMAPLKVQTGANQSPHTLQARRNLCAFLGTIPPGEWTSIDALVTKLKMVQPDFMRTDGDFDTWSVLQGETGQLIRGYATWDLIEAVAVRNMLLGPLYWLGIVALGVTSEPGPNLFQVTRTGSDVLNQKFANTERPVEKVTAEVKDDFSIHIPLQDSLYERFQLERFALWQPFTEKAVYLLSEQSVWEGVNAGITVEQVLRFLERLSNEQLSPVVRRSLHAWGSRFGRVILHKAVVLEVQDAEVMEQMVKQPGIRRLLGVEITATQRLVPVANLAVLVERLKQIGIWPTIKL